MASVITGTGVSVPPHVVTNDDLALIMDTSDEWIRTRTGVRQRRFVSLGVGASDLAIEAAGQAIGDAGIDPTDVDLLVTATMTPDFIAPGIGGLVQAGLGLGPVTTIDLRQQCSGFLYGLDLVDAYFSSGRATTAVVVGAEVHGGFFPWGRASWDRVLGKCEKPIPAAEFRRNTAHRSWSVLFGDGAGAMVLQHVPAPSVGILTSSLHTDGDAFDLILVPGAGFKYRPYVSEQGLADDGHLPTMDGGGLYRRAVRLMPEAADRALATVGLGRQDIDLVIAHQANARILEGVRKRFGMDPSRVPSNIDAWGNTTAGTIPILFHEVRKLGGLAPGAVVCFAAFGAGAHYGAILYREPR